MEWMRRWQVALAGIGAVCTAFTNAIIAQMDGDALTVPDWNLAFTALFAAIGLFQARPNSVSSQSLGVK